MRSFLFLSVLVCGLFFSSAAPFLQVDPLDVQPREPFLAKIHTSGDLLEPLGEENIMFYEGRREVSFDHSLYYYNDTYYLSVVFPREGEFRIESDEILYSLADEVGSVTLSEEVNVSYSAVNSDGSVKELLSVKPGIVYTYGNRSQLDLVNRGSESLDVSVGERSFRILPFQARTINLNLVHPYSVISISSYKDFSVPVIFLGAKKEDEKVENDSALEVEVSYFSARPRSLELTLVANKSYEREIDLVNNASVAVKEIVLLKKGEMMAVDHPSKVDAGSVEPMMVEFYSPDTSKNESILLSYVENETVFNLSIDLFFNITNGSGAVEENEILCSEVGGVICNGSCEGKSNFTSDGYCCYGLCVPLSGENGDVRDDDVSYGWLIGLLIFLVLAVVSFLLYRKYKSALPDEPKRKIDDTNKKYEKRLKGAVTKN